MSKRVKERKSERKLTPASLSYKDNAGAPKRRMRGPQGRFVPAPSACLHKQTEGDAGTGKSKTRGQFLELAAELKAVAAIDSQLEQHFDIGKYPRIKAALEEAVSARVEEIIRQRFAGLEGKQKDYRRVTLTQLIEITKKKRRTIYFWIDKGLPREEDGSFWLPKVFEWLESYTEQKVLERIPDRAMNPYQMERARQMRQINAENEHRLLDRTEVLAGQIARHQNLVNSFTHKAEELARDAAGQPEAVIAKMLGEFLDGVLRQQCSVPEQLHLPADIAEQFSELLRKLIIDK